MALQIDTSKALRTHDELIQLVDAVLLAGPGDENIAVEWKSKYENILSKEASFALARAILAFANRDISTAKTAFEGVAYVVVGAEPGNLSDQTVPDSAELSNAIRRYTGSGFPRWDMRPINYRKSQVLIFIIEAPVVGDPIALLQKNFQATPTGKEKQKLTPEGTIFVRRPGSTERATAADIELLQKRLVAGAENSAAALRKDEQKRYCRNLIAEMAQAAERWRNTTQVMVIAGADSGWSRADLSEFVNSDSGRQMTADMQTIQTNARKIRLEVTNPNLLAALNVALEHLDDVGARDPTLRDRASTGEERSAAYRNLFSIEYAFERLEEVAREVFAVEEEGI